MKIHSVEAKLYHAERQMGTGLDGQTWRSQITFSNFMNMSKNEFTIVESSYSIISHLP
jgi:hypothetical protein